MKLATSFILSFCYFIAWHASSASAMQIRPVILVAGPSGSNLNTFVNTTRVACADINARNVTQTAAFSNLQVVQLTLTGNFRSDLALVNATAANPAGIPLLAVVFQYSDIAIAFGERQIPVAFLGSFAGIPSDNQFVFQMIPDFQLQAAAFGAACKLLGFSNLAIFTTVGHLSVAEQMPAILKQYDVNVEFIELNPTIDHRRARIRLEQSRTQVVLAMADRGNLASWSPIRGFTNYELFNWEPTQTYTPGWISRIDAATSQPQTRARFFPVPSELETDRNFNFLAVTQPNNLTRWGRFSAIARSVGIGIPASIFNSATMAGHAIDAPFLAARSVAAVSGAGLVEFNSSAIVERIFMDPTVTNDGASGVLVSGPYRFHPRTGERVGSFDILSAVTRLPNATLVLTKFGEINFPQGHLSLSDSWVDLSTPNIRFASTRQIAPMSSTKPPLLLFGMLSYGSSNSSVAAAETYVWQIWQEVARAAAADATREDTASLNGFKVDIIFLNCIGLPPATISSCGRSLFSLGATALLVPPLMTDVRAVASYSLQRTLVGWATSADELNDPNTFQNSIVLSASDAQSSITAAQLFKQFGWSRACLVYSGTLESTSLQLSITRTFQANNLTILQQTSLPAVIDPANTTIHSSLENIKRADCRVIISALGSPELAPVFTAAQNLSMIGLNSTYTWIFSESASISLWRNTQNRSIQDSFDADLLVGSFLLKTHESRAEQPASLLSVASRFGVTSLPPFAHTLYDSVRILARGAAKVLRPGMTYAEIERADVSSGVRDSSFAGISGPIAFSESERRDIAVEIVNFGSSEPRSIGYWSQQGGLLLQLEPMFSDLTNQIPADRYVFPRSTLSFSAPGATAAVFFAVLIVVLNLASAGLIWLRRDVKIIRASSPIFLVTICFGLALAASSVLFWFGDPTAHTCRSRLWFAFVGCCISFNSVLAKNWRLWYLFYEASMKIFRITNQQLFGVVGGASLPVVIALLFWTAYPPGFGPSLQFDVSGTFQWRTCSSNGNDVPIGTAAFGYMGLLMLAGASLSFKTRKLPSKIKESAHIAITTYFILFMSVTGIVLGYLLNSDPVSSTFVVVVCLLVATTGFYAAMVGTKVVAVLRHDRSQTSAGRGSGTSATGSQSSARSSASGSGSEKHH